MQIDYLGRQIFKIKAKQASLTVSIDKVEIFKSLDEKPFVIEFTGEYEVAGVSVFGRNQYWMIEVDEMLLVYFRQHEADLSEEQLSEIEEIDILIVPLKEGELTASKIVKSVSKIQPNIVLVGESGSSSKFINELGIEEVKKENRFVIAKNDLPEDLEARVLINKNG